MKAALNAATTVNNDGMYGTKEVSIFLCVVNGPRAHKTKRPNKFD